MTVVYDAGALIAADRSDRETWADHRARLELGVVPVTTAPVVAQVSRAARQAQLRRFLRGCEVVPFAEGDAHVVVVAHRHGYAVVTSDERGLRPIVTALGQAVRLIRV